MYLDKMNEELVQLYRDTLDSEVFEELYDRFSGFSVTLSYRYFAKGAAREDIIQEAYIGLYNAVRDFDPTRGRFNPFAYLCMERQVQTFIKLKDRKKHSPLNNSLHSFSYDYDDKYRSGRSMIEDSPVVRSEKNTTLLKYSSASAEDAYFNEIPVDWFEEFLEGLSEKEKAVLSIYLEGDMSYQDIADRLNIEAKSVDTALWRCRRKLRKFLQEMELKEIS